MPAPVLKPSHESARGPGPSPFSARQEAPVRGDFPTRDILGVAVSVCAADEARAHIVKRLAAGLKTPVAFANANLLNIVREHPRGPALLKDVFVLNDGVGMDVAAKLLYGATFPENLNGTDFTPALLSALPPDARVFLFGAREDVVEVCARVIPERFGANVVGYHHGYTHDFAAVADAINASGAHVVLVALGNPAQEVWIADYMHQTRATVYIGVGAYLDFLAEKFPRAPMWMRKLRLEFVYRLMQEPRRLAKRYTVDLVVFLARVLGQRRDRLSSDR